MPRLRRPEFEVRSDGVPAALLDPECPVWDSEAETAEWLSLNQLSIGQALEWGPLNRRAASAKAWARANGLTSKPLSNGYVGLDAERCRAMGLRVESGGDLFRERFELVGVRIEDAYESRSNR